MILSPSPAGNVNPFALALAWSSHYSIDSLSVFPEKNFYRVIITGISASPDSATFWPSDRERRCVLGWVLCYVFPLWWHVCSYTVHCIVTIPRMYVCMVVVRYRLRYGVYGSPVGRKARTKNRFFPYHSIVGTVTITQHREIWVIWLIYCKYVLARK